MKLTANRIVSEVLRWFQKHHRKLPWRETRDPYSILVSEIMLQQTQVSRIEAKYPEFLERYPTFEALAKASKGEVIRAWSGMGYNIRALRLRAIARIVIERFNGRLPTSAEILRELPGIGRYTAHALCCFAHGKPMPIVETNVRRVLTRIFWRTTSSTSRQDPELVWKLAGKLIPENKSVEWNLALMDLGATVCRANAPRCQDCPVRKFCHSAFRIKRDRRPATRHEPIYQGQPRRYYRGRIIEALRNVHHNKWVSGRSLGPRVKPGFKLRELSWLQGVLRQLERDGMIVTLGKNSSAGMHVRLAR